MKVFLVRHGLAGGGEDPALTPKGQKRVRNVAAFLAKAGVKPARLCHSHLQRARETALILSPEVAPGVTVEEVDGLLPEDPPQQILERIEAAETDLMLVGHMPHLGMLASLLLTGTKDSATIAFARAGAACFERPDKSYGWYLDWSIRPGLLKKE